MTKKHHFKNILDNKNIDNKNIDNNKQDTNPRTSSYAFLYNHILSLQNEELKHAELKHEELKHEELKHEENIQQLQYIEHSKNTPIESEISANSNKPNSEQQRGCLEITSEITSEIQFDIF